MSLTKAKLDISAHSAFAAFYDAENERFVVDFSGNFPFTEMPLKIKDGGMFVHGVCTDKEGVDDWHLGCNAVVVHERHLTSDSVPEALDYLLGRAADRLSSMSAKALQEANDSVWGLRCEIAARLITEHKTRMIDELVASYNEQKRGERA